MAKLFALFRDITSNHNEGSYSLNCLYSFRTKTKQKEFCKDHKFFQIKLSTEENSLLKYHQDQKLIKLSFVNNNDFQTILEKISIYENNPEISDTTEINKHIVCGFFTFFHLLNFYSINLQSYNYNILYNYTLQMSLHSNVF